MSEKQGGGTWLRLPTSADTDPLFLPTAADATALEALAEAVARIENEGGGTGGSAGQAPKQAARQAPTLREAIDRVDGAEQLRASLERYASALAEIQVSRIKITHLVEVLNPIWHLSPNDADEVRQGISIIMRWAIGQGSRTDDPASENLIERIYGEHRSGVVHERIRCERKLIAEAWWSRAEIPGDFGFWWRQSGYRKGRERPLPPTWVDWMAKCVKHGCLGSHAEDLFLCKGFPFDTEPPPVEAVDCWPYTGEPGYEDRPDLIFAEFVRWASKLLRDVQEAWPYPAEADRFGDDDEDKQAVIAYAGWLERCLDLGIAEDLDSAEGVDWAKRERLETQLVDVKRGVLLDLMECAGKDIVWHRVLSAWTQAQIIVGRGVPPMISEWWDKRPTEPSRGRGRPLNSIVVQARARDLMRMLTRPRNGVPGVLPVQSTSPQNASASELVAALLKCRPSSARYAYEKALPTSRPRFLSLSNRSKIELGGESYRACVDGLSVRP